MHRLHAAARCVTTLLMIFLLLGLPARSAAAEGGPSGHGPTVEVSQEIHFLELDRTRPKCVEIGAYLRFTWHPAELPQFGIGELHFLNKCMHVEQRIIQLKPRDSDGMTGAIVAVRGHFECANDFSAYPFNTARIPLIFERPAGDYSLRVPRQQPDRLFLAKGRRGILSDSYRVIQATLHEGTFLEIWQDNELGAGSHDLRALALYIDASHRPVRAVCMVFLPLLCIWAVAYSSQWWKEESAASRSIMASTFAVAALAFSSINLQPNVSYMTTGILAFTMYYVNLFVFGLLTVMAFRADARDERDAFRLYRRIGRIAGPVMFVVCLAILMTWIFAHENASLVEWLADARPIPE